MYILGRSCNKNNDTIIPFTFARAKINNYKIQTALWKRLSIPVESIPPTGILDSSISADFLLPYAWLTVSYLLPGLMKFARSDIHNFE